MGIILNRRRVCGGKSLSYDAEIEYLESTGTQYINTGVYPNSNTTSIKVKTKVAYLALKTTQNKNPFTIGSSDDSGSLRAFNRFGLVNNHFTYTVSTNTSNKDVQSNVIPTLGKIYDVDYDIIFGVSASLIVRDGGLILVNSVTNDNIQPSKNAYYLFAMNHNVAIDGIREMIGKIYSCKIYNNNIIVVDLIPVRVGTIGYLYDRVSGQLFGNAGTGSFILGPDK